MSKGLKNACILLIEAGPYAPDELKINVPGMKGSTLGTIYDWNFTTVPQVHVKDRVWTAPRGKVLGGSSALNLMTWDRASKVEYDAWEALGNPGWNWNSMIKYMKKAENFTGANTATYGSKGVGFKGPVQTVVNRFIPEYQHDWIPTLERWGVPKNLESLGGDPLGVMWQPSSVSPTHYNRSYSANSYLPISGPNLVVLTNTRVAKVNLQKSGKKYKATGVTLTTGDIINASAEVILSAGTIQSPGLLELSGIGQASVLSAAGIEQKIDLPGVGENLQDHVRIQASYQLKPNYTSIDIFRYNATYAAEQLQLWKEGRFSRYDYTASAYAFLDWSQISLTLSSTMLALARQAAAANPSSVTVQKQLELASNPAIPRLELILSDGYTGTKGYPPPTSPLYGANFATVIAGVMHSYSRGSVHIPASSPTTSPPVLNPNYLSTAHDLRAAIEGFRLARRAATSAPLRAAWTSEYEPGTAAVPPGDAGAEREYVLDSAASIYHPVGTCAMLPRAAGGVVDAALRVYGVGGLRVVDAAIIPLLVSGHIQTAVYGIAEFAAEMIIQGVIGKRCE